jgi:molybdate transport system substrate-binding protein
MKPVIRIVTLIVSLMAASAGLADTLRLACASNFQPTLEKLVTLWRTQHPQSDIDIISGSSGQLYQQIRHGAPFHLFFSADRTYAERLHSTLATPAPVTYALGRLVLWSPQGKTINANTLALANPATAPYGRAARQVIPRLRSEGLITGELTQVIATNVGQATRFVDSGNADMGLIALSLIQGRHRHYQLIPEDWHEPLRQDAVVLTPEHGNAQAFIDFVTSQSAREVVRASGYGLPPMDTLAGSVANAVAR